MFFKKKVQDRFIETKCPCLTLNNVPSLVILPGVRYDITFDGILGTHILDYYKTHKNLSFDTITNLDNIIYPNDKNFHSSKGNYICLIPAKSLDCNTGCIAKFIKITKSNNNNNDIIFSFKAIRRAAIVTPLYNSGNKIWESDLIMFNDKEKLSNLHRETVLNGSLNLFEIIQFTEKNIMEFNKRYINALRENSTDNLFLLTPLSNTLYFQLNKPQFKKSWRLLCDEFESLNKPFLSNETDGSNYTDMTNIDIPFKLLNLLDFFVSVLPTSVLQKIEFLGSMDIEQRVEMFNKIINDFNQIFDQLFFSVNYVKEYFDHANTLEKANLIANHLKSLKVFIQDIKHSNDLKSRLLPNSNTNYNSHKPNNSLIKSKMINKGNNKLIRSDGTPSNLTEKDDRTSEIEDEDDLGDSGLDDIDIIKKFVINNKKLQIHNDGRILIRKDFKRLIKMTPNSGEYQVLRNYFDIIMDIPFNNFSKQNLIDINTCKKRLDNDHYGLLTVKKRLIEYLCVLKLNRQLDNPGRPPILLLVGPPGVGKTSIAKSIACVLDRNYQRISLGGVNNESDLRGHRRTYVGSMCGLLINALRKSGTMNPLILLDEIDKVASTVGNGSNIKSINGDPGAALLEILDPEQNSSFMDHFVGFPVDLSQALFICTANDISGISQPLLDRMEVIKIPGYTVEEKIEIGKQFLLPKQIKLNGLDKCNGQFTMEAKTWQTLVTQYTRESGVRNLERQLSKIVRGKVVEYVANENKFQNANTIKENDLIPYLGFPLHPLTKELLSTIELAAKEGVVNGLSYNSDGTGSVLIFEIIKVGPCETGKGPQIKSTGNLGNILQESIDIGCSLVKSIIRREVLHKVEKGLHEDNLVNKDFFNSQYHLHVPMGSTSKDGPSAGMAITLAILSMAVSRPVDPKICMTGEITLRGKILPIGGIKEKILGAKMYGMEKILIPKGNRNDVIDMVTDEPTDKIRNELSILYEKYGLQATYVDTIYDVIPLIWSDLQIKLKDITADSLPKTGVTSAVQGLGVTNRAHNYKIPLDDQKNLLEDTEKGSEHSLHNDKNYTKNVVIDDSNNVNKNTTISSKL